MSHYYTASLEYTNICISMLDDANSKIVTILNECISIESNSNALLDENIRSLIYDVKESCTEIQSKIHSQKENLSDAVYSTQIEDTQSSLSDINSLLIRSKMLNDTIQNAYLDKMDRISEDHGDVSNQLAGISDQKLKSMITLLSKNRAHDELSFDELKSLAEVKLDPSKKTSRKLTKQIFAELIQQMASEHVSEEIIEKVTGGNDPCSPLEMMNVATEKILDERLCRSAVQAIIKSISARGFIINKSNIRVIKETNTVNIIALKPGGQKAEFSIDLNGKFSYKFDGYEGRACEKDIEPLENDLESVYGIKIKNRKTVWSNPDKLNKTYHAEMNVKRDN